MADVSLKAQLLRLSHDLTTRAACCAAPPFLMLATYNIYTRDAGAENDERKKCKISPNGEGETRRRGQR